VNAIENLGNVLFPLVMTGRPQLAGALHTPGDGEVIDFGSLISRLLASVEPEIDERLRLWAGQQTSPEKGQLQCAEDTFPAVQGGVGKRLLRSSELGFLPIAGLAVQTGEIPVFTPAGWVGQKVVGDSSLCEPPAINRHGDGFRGEPESYTDVSIGTRQAGDLDVLECNLSASGQQESLKVTPDTQKQIQPRLESVEGKTFRGIVEPKPFDSSAPGSNAGSDACLSVKMPNGSSDACLSVKMPNGSLKEGTLEWRGNSDGQHQISSYEGKPESAAPTRLNAVVEAPTSPVASEQAQATPTSRQGKEGEPLRLERGADQARFEPIGDDRGTIAFRSSGTDMMRPAYSQDTLKELIADTKGESAPKKNQRDTLGGNLEARQPLDFTVRNSSVWQPSSQIVDAPVGTDRHLPLEHVFPQKLVHQIVKAARVSLSRGSGEMSLRLEPPELGSVQVRVLAEEGTVTASLRVSTEAAKQIFEADLSLLRQSLSDAGIHVDSVSVSLSADAHKEMTMSNGQNGPAQQFGGSHESRDPRRESAVQGRLSWSAGGLSFGSGFDYLA